APATRVSAMIVNVVDGRCTRRLVTDGTSSYLVLVIADGVALRAPRRTGAIGVISRIIVDTAQESTTSRRIFTPPIRARSCCKRRNGAGGNADADVAPVGTVTHLHGAG